MRPARHFVVAIVAILVLVPVLTASAVGPTVAAPPPEELCGVCGPALEGEASEVGVALTVEHSSATIDVVEGGTGHWHARVRLDDAAATRVAQNATLREHVVRETYAHGRTVVDEPRDLQTSVENDTLVVDFDLPNVAHESVGGAVLVDLLDYRTRRAGIRVVADELRIRGPEGTAVTRSPPGATVEDGAVSWRTDRDGVALHGDTRLAFAPSDGPIAQGATTLALVGYGIYLAGTGVFFLAALPVIGFAAGLLALHRWHDTLPAFDGTRIVTGIVGGGAVAAAVGTVAWILALVVDPLVAETVTVFAVLYGLVGAGALLLDRPSPRLSLAWTVGTALLVAVATSPVSNGAFQTALLSVPTVLMFPLGRARGRDRTLTQLLSVAFVASPVGAAVLYHPPASPVFALLGSLITTVPWAAATLLFGFPLYLVGRDPRESASSDQTAPSSGVRGD